MMGVFAYFSIKAKLRSDFALTYMTRTFAFSLHSHPIKPISPQSGFAFPDLSFCLFCVPIQFAWCVRQRACMHKQHTRERTKVASSKLEDYMYSKEGSSYHVIQKHDSPVLALLYASRILWKKRQQEKKRKRLFTI